jgi:hypothetical protein
MIKSVSNPCKGVEERCRTVLSGSGKAQDVRKLTTSYTSSIFVEKWWVEEKETATAFLSRHFLSRRPVKHAQGTVTTHQRRLLKPHQLKPYSGPATFLPSTSPVLGSRISSQLTASSASPVDVETAKRTPREFDAVERKSARGRSG